MLFPDAALGFFAFSALGTSWFTCQWDWMAAICRNKMLNIQCRVAKEINMTSLLTGSLDPSAWLGIKANALTLDRPTYECFSILNLKQV